MSHFLRMRGLQRGEIIRLFARAAQLKRRRREGRLEDSLTGKTVVLLMERQAPAPASRSPPPRSSSVATPSS